MQFTLGHIDNSGFASKYLEVFYMDSDGEYKQAFSINLTSEMPVDVYSFKIYNTRSLKIKTYEASGAGNVRYGMADVYLIE